MSAAHVIETPIRRTAFVARPPFAGSTIDPLGVEGIRMTFSRNQEIFGEGEPADYIYRVVSGAVRTYTILNDGRRQISEFFLAGDVFGLDLGGEHTLSAEALDRTVVVAMKRRWLVTLAATDCEVAQKLWSLSLHDLRRSQEHMLLLGRKSALERVVCFLMDMAERIPADREVVLPMSRQDIADYLGLTIETVSRTMTQLQEDSLIELRGCRHVVLRDRGGLVDIIAA